MQIQEHIQKILALRDTSLKRTGNFDYGANVLPVIEYYITLKEPSDRRSFLDAVETMLRSEDEKQREYAVTLCLGFVVFRDAV